MKTNQPYGKVFTPAMREPRIPTGSVGGISRPKLAISRPKTGNTATISSQKTGHIATTSRLKTGNAAKIENTGTSRSVVSDSNIGSGVRRYETREEFDEAESQKSFMTTKMSKDLRYRLGTTVDSLSQWEKTKTEILNKTSKDDEDFKLISQYVKKSEMESLMDARKEDKDELGMRDKEQELSLEAETLKKYPYMAAANAGYIPKQKLVDVLSCEKELSNSLKEYKQKEQNSDELNKKGTKTTYLYESTYASLDKYYDEDDEEIGKKSDELKWKKELDSIIAKNKGVIDVTKHAEERLKGINNAFSKKTVDAKHPKYAAGLKKEGHKNVESKIASIPKSRADTSETSVDLAISQPGKTWHSILKPAAPENFNKETPHLSPRPLFQPSSEDEGETKTTLWSKLVKKPKTSREAAQKFGEFKPKVGSAARVVDDFDPITKPTETIGSTAGNLDSTQDAAQLASTSQIQKSCGLGEGMQQLSSTIGNLSSKAEQLLEHMVAAANRRVILPEITEPIYDSQSDSREHDTEDGKLNALAVAPETNAWRLNSGQEVIPKKNALKNIPEEELDDDMNIEEEDIDYIPPFFRRQLLRIDETPESFEAISRPQEDERDFASPFWGRKLSSIEEEPESFQLISKPQADDSELSSLEEEPASFHMISSPQLSLAKLAKSEMHEKGTVELLRKPTTKKKVVKKKLPKAVTSSKGATFEHKLPATSNKMPLRSTSKCSRSTATSLKGANLQQKLSGQSKLKPKRSESKSSRSTDMSSTLPTLQRKIPVKSQRISLKPTISNSKSSSTASRLPEPIGSAASKSSSTRVRTLPRDPIRNDVFRKQITTAEKKKRAQEHSVQIREATVQKTCNQSDTVAKQLQTDKLDRAKRGLVSRKPKDQSELMSGISRLNKVGSSVDPLSRPQTGLTNKNTKLREVPTPPSKEPSVSRSQRVMVSEELNSKNGKGDFVVKTTILRGGGAIAQKAPISRSEAALAIMKTKLGKDANQAGSELKKSWLREENVLPAQQSPAVWQEKPMSEDQYSALHSQEVQLNEEQLFALKFKEENILPVQLSTAFVPKTAEITAEKVNRTQELLVDPPKEKLREEKLTLPQEQPVLREAEAQREDFSDWALPHLPATSDSQEPKISYRETSTLQSKSKLTAKSKDSQLNAIDPVNGEIPSIEPTDSSIVRKPRRFSEILMQQRAEETARLKKTIQDDSEKKRLLGNMGSQKTSVKLEESDELCQQKLVAEIRKIKILQGKMVSKSSLASLAELNGQRELSKPKAIVELGESKLGAETHGAFFPKSEVFNSKKNQSRNKKNLKVAKQEEAETTNVVKQIPSLTNTKPKPMDDGEVRKPKVTESKKKSMSSFKSQTSERSIKQEQRRPKKSPESPELDAQKPSLFERQKRAFLAVKKMAGSAPNIAEEDHEATGYEAAAEILEHSKNLPLSDDKQKNKIKAKEPKTTQIARPKELRKPKADKSKKVTRNFSGVVHSDDEEPQNPQHTKEKLAESLKPLDASRLNHMADFGRSTYVERQVQKLMPIDAKKLLTIDEGSFRTSLDSVGSEDEIPRPPSAKSISSSKQSIAQNIQKAKKNSRTYINRSGQDALKVYSAKEPLETSAGTSSTASSIKSILKKTSKYDPKAPSVHTKLADIYTQKPRKSKNSRIPAKQLKMVSWVDAKNPSQELGTFYPIEPNEWSNEGAENDQAEITGNDFVLDEEIELQKTAKFAAETFNFMEKFGRKHRIQENHLSHQKYITPKHRAELVDWLITAHADFDFYQSTYYMAVQIIDRYLQAVPDLKPEDLSKIGMTALFNAVTYEDKIPPNEFIKILPLTAEEFEKTSWAIQNALEFDMAMELPARCLNTYIKLAKPDTEQVFLARYLMQLATTEYKLAHCVPRLIAAAALLLALNVFTETTDGFHPELWTEQLQQFSGFTVDMLIPVTKQLARLAWVAPRLKLNAAYRKFRSSKFYQVARLCLCPAMRAHLI